MDSISPSTKSDLRTRISAYLQQEPRQDYRACIEQLQQRSHEGDADAIRELTWRLQPLAFGTAGLRALMGAGDGLMNQVTVTRVAWALGQHLLARVQESYRQNICRQGIVMGYDARHNSAQFAQDMAAVLTGLGFHIHVFNGVTATPLCAFATKFLQAAAGVLITASHNPAGDNGIKFYRADGTQIHEDDSKPIAALLPRASEVFSSMRRLSAVKQCQTGLRHAVTPAVTEAYLAAIDSWSPHCVGLHPKGFGKIKTSREAASGFAAKDLDDSKHPERALRDTLLPELPVESKLPEGAMSVGGRAPLFPAVPINSKRLERSQGVAKHPHPVGKGRQCPPQLRIVYTPLHGVGGELALRALARAGFTDVHMVSQQAAPDGDFPTAPSPNPENPGVLRLAMELADQVDADLILANDPDADRLAVCVRHPRTGAWEPLSGDAVGVLLGQVAASRFATKAFGGIETSREAMGVGGRAPLFPAVPINSKRLERSQGVAKHPHPVGKDTQCPQGVPHWGRGVMVTTVVSSQMLERIAGDYGMRYAQTLTGFRHIAAASRRLAEAGEGAFVFGYEESLGYCMGDTVLEKDGIASAVRVAELALQLLLQNKTLHQQLDELALRWGLHCGKQFSVEFAGPGAHESMRALMQRLRGNRNVAAMPIGSPVVRCLDLLKKPLVGHSPANVLVFHLADGGRWIARPSGTEPKVKFYVEYVRSVKTLAQLDATRAELGKHIQVMQKRVLKEFGGG